MQCSHCKTELNRGDRFCGHCGKEQLASTTQSCWRWPLLLLGIVLVVLGVVDVVQNSLILRKLDRVAAVDDMAADDGGTNEIDQASPHHFNDAEEKRWTSPMAPMVFQALDDPCTHCKLGILKSFCAKGKGDLAVQELINSQFAEGHNIKEVFAYFVKACGVEVLTPQAREIYEQKHPPR